ncbi:hypothetical protein HK405_006493, partial [Cladochytrium tenue]
MKSKSDSAATGSPHRSPKKRKMASVFALVGGTDSGQLVALDISIQGGREIALVQAHGAEVCLIEYVEQWSLVISAGK